LTGSHQGVTEGVMMREPALKYRGKVFAFYYQDKNAMTFKLGKNYHIESHGITDYEFLSPFKNKPPMTAWYVIPAQHAGKWEELSRLALEAMR
jgi:hypothetical protein